MAEFYKNLSPRNQQLFDIYTSYLYDNFMMTTLGNESGHICYLTVSWTGITNSIRMIILSPDITSSSEIHSGYGEDSICHPVFYIDKDSNDLVICIGNTRFHDTKDIYNTVVDIINNGTSVKGHKYKFIGTDLKKKYNNLIRTTRTLYPYSDGSSQDYINAIINKEVDTSNVQNRE